MEFFEVDITLPYPPSGNHMWKKTKAGHTYLTPDARRYYGHVKWQVATEAKMLNLDSELFVMCTLRPPDKRRRDLDNAWKVVSDSLTKARLWQDDHQIRRLVLQWGEPVEGGQVTISVFPAAASVEINVS